MSKTIPTKKASKPNINKRPVSSKKYDYLIVGSGFFGSVFARLAKDAGKKVLIIEKRNHIGGNCASYLEHGIDIHKYGAHIFHTDYDDVWQFVNKYSRFNNFVNSPIANYNGKIYNLPFNMNTLYSLFGTVTPNEVEKKLEKEKAEYSHITEPKNLEEKALTLVGKTVYETLIKGYTEKQWGRKATELPAFIISRLPFRLSYDNNYFTDRYQGIPENGYNELFKNLLKGVEIKLETDFFAEKEKYLSLANTIVFTGKIDEYFNYELGELEYRSLSLENEVIDTENYQGVAVVNYTDSKTPYTRIIEHKHFNNKAESFKLNKTVITKEYPKEYELGSEPYYVVNNDKNNALARAYRELAKKQKNIIFGGRLAEYKYYDMDDVIKSSLLVAKNELN